MNSGLSSQDLPRAARKLCALQPPCGDTDRIVCGTRLAGSMTMTESMRPEETRVRPGPATPTRILFVDDEDAVLFAVTEFFEVRGYDITCARETDEAKTLLVDSHYSAAVVDLRLNGGDGTEGLELVSYVRARCEKTKVLVLTAYGSAEVEDEARRRGADAFLHKPRSLSEVENTVLDLLAAHR